MCLFNFLKKDKETILGIEFPIFNGKRVWCESKNTHKYKRKDYYYKLTTDLANYIEAVYTYGFNRKDEKKYVKDNSYIIIENENNKLHIAFHVNK